MVALLRLQGSRFVISESPFVPFGAQQVCRERCFHCRSSPLRNLCVNVSLRVAGVRLVLPDPSESSNEVGSWLPPRPEEQVGRAPGGAALRGGVGGKGEAATPIQV